MRKLQGSRIASACGCETTKKIVRGMCVPHYDRWVQTTPKNERPPAPRTVRNFSDHVDKSGDCWLWTGPKNRKGYGLWSNGTERGLAHRISLAQIAPADNASMMSCHRCDNPPCVNPEHLYWGTAKDNARDVIERGTPKNQNSDATHCKRGHELSGHNLQIFGKVGARQCRACGNERSRKNMAARRARRAAAV